MTKHIHADSMVKYAEDAAETETPWKRWQFKVRSDIKWCDCDQHPTWRIDMLYRRKPKVLHVAGVAFPDMILNLDDIESDTKVYVVNCYYCWFPMLVSEEVDKMQVMSFHKTKESAEAYIELIKPKEMYV